ncbi:MAG TPA: ferredoxin--NADP reductase [Mucilaginibacter sp.]|nr:ferredoxin--NADP reductase [Mucilaginibacter sp.]
MLQLRIEDIKWETPDTATFFLSEISGKHISYKAGQFLTFIFSHHDEEIRRSYSLSSSPDEKLLAVTVKRIPNGEISRFMLTKLKPGDVLNAVEPAGRFTVADFNTEKDIFFFAAGSGITPVISHLKYILKREGYSRLILIYSTKNDPVIFRPELNALVLAHAHRLQIVYLLSAEGRRLNNTMVERLVKANNVFGLDKAEFYLCGPFDYMRMVRLTLLYMGIGNKQIRRENFVIDTIKVSGNLATYPPGKVRIHFGNEIYDITTGENQSILQAALQNKIPLPYSCRTGSCSTCSAICTSGKVVMPVNEVLTEDDLAKGWILTCTGYAVGEDVVIEYTSEL